MAIRSLNQPLGRIGHNTLRACQAEGLSQRDVALHRLDGTAVGAAVVALRTRLDEAVAVGEGVGFRSQRFDDVDGFPDRHAVAMSLWPAQHPGESGALRPILTWAPLDSRT